MKNIKHLILMVFLISSCNIDDLPITVYEEYTPTYIEALLTKYGIALHTLSNTAVKRIFYLDALPDSLMEFIADANFTRAYYSNNSYVYVNVFGGNVVISGKRIWFDTKSFSYHEIHYDSKPCDTCSKFGSTELWSVSGSDTSFIYAFSIPFYSPKTIKLLNIKDYDTISRSKDILIKWEPDYSNRRGVAIIVEYNSYLNKDFLTNPPEKVYQWHTIVPDSGRFTIPKEKILAMNKIPQNCYVQISIGRGNDTSIAVNGVYYNLQALCFAEYKVFLGK